MNKKDARTEAAAEAADEDMAEAAATADETDVAAEATVAVEIEATDAVAAVTDQDISLQPVRRKLFFFSSLLFSFYLYYTIS